MPSVLSSNLQSPTAKATTSALQPTAVVATNQIKAPLPAPAENPYVIAPSQMATALQNPQIYATPQVAPASQNP